MAGALVLAACSSSVESSTPTSDAPSTSNVDVDSTPTTLVAEPSTTVESRDAAPVLDSAAAVAAELSFVEGALRDVTRSDDDLDLLGRRQQLAYRAVNRHPEWADEIVASVTDVAAGPLRHHLDAKAAWDEHSAGREPSDPPTELPAWTIVAPLPAEELLGYYRAAQDATGVLWQYLAAIHFQETRMGRISGTSSAGAVGPMQFLPSTWDECCEGDPTVARDAIVGAAVYLASLGGATDIESALYGYNPNSGYVGAVMAYAQNMIEDERAYVGYHGWQVLFGTSAGTVRLPVGYSSDATIPVEAYLADHPEDLIE